MQVVHAPKTPRPLAPLPEFRGRRRAFASTVTAPRLWVLVAAMALAPRAARAENPLASFRAALRRAASGTGQARILVQGDSHVCSDGLTGALRRTLQARFGDAGPGLLPPIQPTRFCGHHRLRASHGGDWVTVGTPPPRSKAPRVVADCGLAGFAAEARAASAFTEVAFPDGDRVEIALLGQPGGGTALVRLDEAPALEVPTAAGATGTIWARVDVTGAGRHRLVVRPAGDGPVRLLSIAVDRGTRGVVVDALGVDGARVDSQLLCRDPVVAAELAHRSPDLAVLAYGTNEVISGRPTARELDGAIDHVLTRLRAAAPSASCLVLGPADTPLGAAGRLDTVADVQRRAALRHGCAFFDTVEGQGGPGSTARWLAASPPFVGGDLVHFTREGYDEIARAVARALTRGWRLR